MKGEPKELKLTVNGKPCELKVKPKMLLVELLRNELKLTGAKIGCLSSACGACTVNIDGRAVRSCSILALQANGREVTTVEGVADGDKLHPIHSDHWFPDNGIFSNMCLCHFFYSPPCIFRAAISIASIYLT